VNLPGADACEACNQPLTDVQPACAPPKTPIEEGIEADAVSVLRPAAPVAVAPTTPVGEIVSLLAEKNIGCVLVVWVDALVGIFTERDVLMKIGDRLDEVAHEPVRHFMTPAPETLSEVDTIAFALNRMAVGGFRHIPIERDEHPVGVVSVRDVLGYLSEHFPEILSAAE
jgi:CBS domain-containing protein